MKRTRKTKTTRSAFEKTTQRRATDKTRHLIRMSGAEVLSQTLRGRPTKLPALPRARWAVKQDHPPQPRPLLAAKYRASLGPHQLQLQLRRPRRSRSLLRQWMLALGPPRPQQHGEKWPESRRGSAATTSAWHCLASCTVAAFFHFTCPRSAFPAWPVAWRSSASGLAPTSARTGGPRFWTTFRRIKSCTSSSARARRSAASASAASGSR
mmetsp:Transcript_6296/g.15597  ORF Transcript_6296/g.15597 Transcript_6296/m.15597 type:complete len:210 (-) Transcript_6296:159-788(-)